MKKGKLNKIKVYWFRHRQLCRFFHKNEVLSDLLENAQRTVDTAYRNSLVTRYSLITPNNVSYEHVVSIFKE